MLDPIIQEAARWYDDNWEDACERPAAALREKFGLKFSQIVAVVAESERIERGSMDYIHSEKPYFYLLLSPWRCDDRRRGGPYHIDLVTLGRVVPCATRANRDGAMNRAEQLAIRFGLDLIIEW